MELDAKRDQQIQKVREEKDQQILELREEKDKEAKNAKGWSDLVATANQEAWTAERDLMAMKDRLAELKRYRDQYQAVVDKRDQLPKRLTNVIHAANGPTQVEKDALEASQHAPKRILFTGDPRGDLNPPRKEPSESTSGRSKPSPAGDSPDCLYGFGPGRSGALRGFGIPRGRG